MAFTAAPLITLVADNLVRLSFDGVNAFGLAAGATGTIGLFEKTVAPGVRLPAAFKPRDYENALADTVDLQSSIQVDVVPTDQNGSALAIGYTVTKAGSDPTDFEISITNTGDAGQEDPTLEFEIYIRFH